MIYQHFPPIAKLAPYIDCLWIIESKAPSGIIRQARMPADSRATMLLNFQGDTRMISTRGISHFLSTGANLLGPHNQSYVLEHSGNTELIAVQFRPGGLSSFMHCEANDLTEEVTPMDLLWGRSGSRLSEQIHEVTTNAEKVIQFQNVLVNRFVETPHQKRILDTLEYIENTKEFVSVEGLAERSNFSQKQFERLFNHIVGMMPKRYIRLARFQSLVYWLRFHRIGENWTSLAAQFGYYDHSHLSKDFQTFAGTTPHEFNFATSGVVEVIYANTQKPQNV